MNSAAKIMGKSKDQTFEKIFFEVMADLIKNYGFKQVKFDAEFSIFGWPHILDKSDWKGERGELLDELADFIKDKNYKNKVNK